MAAFAILLLGIAGFVILGKGATIERWTCVMGWRENRIRDRM